MTAIHAQPGGWTNTGRRASEGDAHSAATVTPPLISGGGEGDPYSYNGQRSGDNGEAGGSLHPNGTVLQASSSTSGYLHPSSSHQPQLYQPHLHPAHHSMTFPPASDNSTSHLTPNSSNSSERFGIASQAPIPPTMTRARSSNEINLKAGTAATSAPANGKDLGGNERDQNDTEEEKRMNARLHSLAARTMGMEPSASFPVALEKARSRREHELDGMYPQQHEGQQSTKNVMVDAAGKTMFDEPTEHGGLPHTSNSYPLLHTAIVEGDYQAMPEHQRQVRPLVLPEYLIPLPAGADRAANRPDLVDMSTAYHRGLYNNPYQFQTQPGYPNLTPPGTSHSPVHPGAPRRDPSMDYTGHEAIVNTLLASNHGSSTSTSPNPNPYEMLNPYLPTSHTPPTPGMYGQGGYYNPYSGPHDPHGRDRGFMGSPVNSSAPVSPVMGMGVWLPPTDDDPATTSMPGNMNGNGLGASASSLQPPLSPTAMMNGPGGPGSGGNWNGWVNGGSGMSHSNGPPGGAPLYGVPSWDPASRPGANGSRGGRAGAGGREGLNGDQQQPGGPSNRNGANGQNRNGGPRGGASGFRPPQPSHTSSFGTAVQNMPVDGYPMGMAPLPNNAYGNGPQGGPYGGPGGYTPYPTGYYAGMTHYPVAPMPYGHLDGRQMLPPGPHSGFSSNRGGRGGGAQPGRRGKWSVGPQGTGGVPGPLAQAQNASPMRNADARPGHRANARSMSSINDVLEQMVIGSPGLVDGVEGEIPGSPGAEDRRAAGRKHYHPAAPANRSDWVMWVGNVPNNATHEEMWKFFHQPIPREAVPASIPYRETIRVSSIFLISRSSCAFVNLETQEELILAISYFNHRILRPADPRCPKLVCRVRKMDDDLKAGVGGQRGAGIHVKYVKELLANDNGQLPGSSFDPAQVVTPDQETLPVSPAALEYPPEGDGRRRSSVATAMITPAAFAAWHHDRSQSGTHSFASTNSSFLGRHFPKRYFILKSLTQEELETSVTTGKWKTQLHNEAILDQAFRTSPEVFLIFGANKQGGFYGWAIMKSGIGSQNRDARSASFGSRSHMPSTPSSNAAHSSSNQEKSSGSTSRSNDDPLVTKSGRPRIPHATSDSFRMTTHSPGELSPTEEISYASMRLPMGVSSSTPQVKGLASVPEGEVRSTTLDPHALARIREGATSSDFKLDDAAPARAVEKRKISAESQETPQDTADDDGIVRHDMAKPVPDEVAEVVEASGPSATENQAKVGSMFEVEWVKTGVLPFHRLRHLRNPWNQDKEVKVSRDGTELEPTVGALLLAEWDKLDPGSLANKA